MDTTQLAAGQVPLKPSSHEIVDLLSDRDSDTEDALLASEPRVNGVNGVNGLPPLLDSQDDEDDDEINTEDEWEIDSMYEDTIEEMGDEHLFEGGEFF